MDKSFKNYKKLKRTIRRRIKILKYFVVGLCGIVIVLSSMMIISGNEVYLNNTKYNNILNKIETINGELESMNTIEDSLHQIATNSDINVNDVTDNSHVKNYEDYQNHVKSITVILNDIENKIDKKSTYYNEIIESVNEKNRILNAMPSIMPISPNECIVGSGYGMRRHPIHKIRKMHQGVDFMSRKGTMVRATADGTVIEAERSSGGYGIMIKIKHDKGYETIYAHLSSLLISKGDIIKKGDVIGLVGSTGLSTGPHLHYEVIKNGKHVDPINYFYNDLTPQEYDKMIAICNSAEMSMD